MRSAEQGLGLALPDDLQRCFTLIRDNPRGFQVRKDDFSHAVLDDFPYRVAFKIKGDDVLMYQVRHTNRPPSKHFGP